jgi:hypothetical protein
MDPILAGAVEPPIARVRREVAAIARRAEVGDLPSITYKVRVGAGDGYVLYLVLAWDVGRIVYLDVRLSLFAYNSGPQRVEQLEVANLRREQVAHARAAMEVVSRQASALLASGLWALEDVIDAWAGTHVYHGGVCPALSPVEGGAQVATGALDAAARHLRDRLPALRRLLAAGGDLPRAI